MSILIGGNSLSSAFVGDSEIKQIWLGETKIWENSTPTGTLPLDASTWQFFKWNCASSTGGSSGSPTPTGAFSPLTCNLVKTATAYSEFACGFCTLNAYDLTDFSKLTLVSNSAQFASNSFKLAVGLSSSLISSYTNCPLESSAFYGKDFSWLPNTITNGYQMTVGSNVTTEFDISNVSGNYYIVFGCGVDNTNSNSGSGTCTVTSAILS